MTEYAVSIIIVCSVVGIASKISSSDDGFSRLAFTLVILYTVIAPLSGIVGELSENEFLGNIDFEYGSDGYEYVEVAREAFERGVSLAISEKFSLSTDSFRVVSVNFDLNLMRADKIKVFLSVAAARADRVAIENYLNSLGVGVCEVEFELG